MEFSVFRSRRGQHLLKDGYLWSVIFDIGTQSGHPWQEKTPGLRCQSALDFRAALEALAAIAPWSDHDVEAWWKNEGDALVLAVRAETASRIEGVLTVGGA